MKAGGSSQKEMLFMRGKAMSGAPIMIGTNQLPKPPIIAGMTMKKTMIRPCAVISTFHRCSASSRLAAAMPTRPWIALAHWPRYWMPGSASSSAHQAGDRAADDARDDREDQVERADILVVRRHEPADEEARLVIGVVMRVMMAMGGLEMDGVCGGVGHVCLAVLVGWSSRFDWWSPASRRRR